MPIINKGWAYVSSSMATTDPGGNDTNIQFNNNGSFSGSALLITDGSGSLSASLNISASSFYGDGSNLTGLTASAVNVADGPEYSIQFRRDSPVSGEISGSAGLIWVPASNALSGTHAQFTAVTASVIAGGSPLVLSASSTTFTGSVIFSGNVEMCNATASIAHLSGCSPITVHAPMSSSQNISASAYYFGPGGRQIIEDSGTDMSILASSTGMFISADGGNLTLQNNVAISTAGIISSSTGITASAFKSNAASGYGVEAPNAGIIAGNFTDGFIQIAAGGISNMHGGIITASSPISSSQLISASAFYGNGAGITGISLINLDAAGSDTNIQFNQNGEFAADAGLVYDGSGSVTISGSYPPSEYIDPSFGLEVTESLGAKLTLGAWGNPYLQTLQYYATSSPGDPPEDAVTIGPFNRLQIYQDGQISLSSSANADPQFEMPAGIELVCNPGNGLVAVETNRVSFLHNTASLSTDEQEYLWSINSDHTDDEDESAWVKLDVDGKEFKVGGADSIKLVAAAGLQVDNSPTVINSALTSSGGAQFTADATFTAGLNAYGNAQIGNASSDVLNVVSTATFDNMSDINSTAGNRTWKVASGSAATGSGPTQNGALLFFSQDGGATKDYLKFHTSGAAPGVVLASNVYMNNVGDNEEQPAGKLSFYVSSSNKGYVTRTTGQQVFNQAAGAGLTASNGQLSTITTVDTTIHQANFSIGSTKQLYLVRTNAAYTGALPTLTSDNQLGQTYVVKDWEGNAETNNICVSGASGQPVDGHGATKVATDYGSVTVCAISSSASGYAWVVIGQT